MLALLDILTRFHFPTSGCWIFRTLFQDPAPIVAALAKALPDVLNASVAELNFKNVVNQLGDVMYTFPFSLPPYYIAIIRCLGVLEGVALQVH